MADVPLVVLINPGSASASEIVSGGFLRRTPARRATWTRWSWAARSYGKGQRQERVAHHDRGHEGDDGVLHSFPDKRIIHRRVGAKTWGVEPDLNVEMLPKQTADALNLRRNADIIPLDEHGAVKESAVYPGAAPDPDDLITMGALTFSLRRQLMLLRAKAVASAGTRITGRTLRR